MEFLSFEIRDKFTRKEFFIEIKLFKMLFMPKNVYLLVSILSRAGLKEDVLEWDENLFKISHHYVYKLYIELLQVVIIP